MFDLNVAERQAYNPWPHSPTAKAAALVPPNSWVLDVGCASGYMAAQLKGKGCRTVGIEIDLDAASLAKVHCEQVITADIEELDALPFPEEHFDTLLCLDILEHLARPDLALRKLRRHLKPQGVLLASIPNVGRAEIRLRLLLGKFDYTDGGIMSKGHLRFFTRQTASRLLTSSGFVVERIIPTGLGSILSVGSISVLPTWTAFQFLFVARPCQE